MCFRRNSLCCKGVSVATACPRVVSVAGVAWNVLCCIAFISFKKEF